MSAVPGGAAPDADGSISDERTPAERAWSVVMERSGIPPRYQAAHLRTNCEVYRDEPGKHRALMMASEWARGGRLEQRDRDRFCLLLSGGYGAGKTWLGSAAFKEQLYRLKSGLWRKFYSFVREVQSSYGVAAPGEGRAPKGTSRADGRSSVDEILARYQSAPVLLLDDVGDLDVPVQSEDRRRLLYEVLDARNDHLLPTIITTNLSPEELAAQFGARTFERVLEMCAMAGMEGKNLRREALP